MAAITENLPTVMRVARVEASAIHHDGVPGGTLRLKFFGAEPDDIGIWQAVFIDGPDAPMRARLYAAAIAEVNRSLNKAALNRSLERAVERAKEPA